MKELTLQRIYLQKATVGILSEGSKVLMFMLEKPWLDNQRNISCIPEGRYVVKLHVSPKFGECLKVFDVPGRSDILIHGGNYVTDTEGCPLPGEQVLDLNGDGIPDVASSKKCVRRLRTEYPDGFVLTVKGGSIDNV